ncbi:hypothetical protein HZA40_02095 [Candidatus Peregrinibacteria bacterium]|nr:hypothetical protein [Candidatus Peregrinibacteria bacterium]
MSGKWSSGPPDCLQDGPEALDKVGERPLSRQPKSGGVDEPAEVSGEMAARVDVGLAIAGTREGADRVVRQVSPFENLDLSRIFSLLLDDGHKRVLDAFFGLEVMSHSEAKRTIVEMFKDQLAGKELDVDKVLAAVAPGAFYSSNPAGDDVLDETSQQRSSRIKKASISVAASNFSEMCADDRRSYCFDRAPGYSVASGFNPGTAGNCPRVLLGLKEFGVEEGELIEFLRYRLFFLELWHRSMEAFQNVIPGVGFHRETYTMAQITTRVTLDQCKRVADDGVTMTEDWVSIPPKNRLVPAPSLRLFGELGLGLSADDSTVENYIKANLSLILPDKGKTSSLAKGNGSFADMAQEEFIIFDLIALADKFGLYEKYAPIFEAIFAYRRAQFMVNFHFNPEVTKNPNPRTATLVTIMKDFYMKQPEGRRKLPYVGDWGDGGGQIGRLLLTMGLVSGVFGIDIDDQISVDVVTEEMDGKYKRVRIATKGLSNDEVRVKINQYFPEVDVLLGCDVTHECSDPKEYIPMLASKVREGGLVYFTDPVHCRSLDNVTHATTYRLDRSEHPQSMLSLERWFNIIGYLNLSGWGVNEINVAPGVVAGYNDSFWRGIYYLSKTPPARRPAPPYLLPVQVNVDLGEIVVIKGRLDEDICNDIFKVWPLCLVSGSDRGQIYNKIAGYVRLLGEAESQTALLRFGVLRKAMCEVIRSYEKQMENSEGGELALVEKRVLNDTLRQKNYDRLWFFRKIWREFGEDEDLRKRRNEARESIFLIAQLRDLFGVNIVNEVRKSPGWEGFQLPEGEDEGGGGE